MRISLPLLALTIALVPAAATAAERDHPGRGAYLKYCGACHGPNGQGDGIAGTFMRSKPTDLTRIAKENGGTFPFTKVIQFIDGTTDVRAHGDPDMPVWGEVFRDQAGWDQTRRAEVRGRLMVITDYLQSIQAK